MMATKYLCIAGLLFSSVVTANENPWADKKITCEEMATSPSKVFINPDLGSGYGSPNEVNYFCSGSLNQIDFLKPLLAQANSIRNPYSIRRCSGSIIHAQWRYYRYSLAWAGYMPETFVVRGTKDKGFEYFTEWSYQSIYNRNIYKNFVQELNRVKPLLVDWYMHNHSVEEKVAKKYTDAALQLISNRGFGSYFYYWEPQALVPFTNEATNSFYRRTRRSV